MVVGNAWARFPYNANRTNSRDGRNKKKKKKDKKHKRERHDSDDQAADPGQIMVAEPGVSSMNLVFIVLINLR